MIKSRDYVSNHKIRQKRLLKRVRYDVTRAVTAALLSKSRKTLHRPVRFSGFKSVRKLCSCS